MKRTLKILINVYPTLEKCSDGILAAFNIIRESYANDGKLLVCGNGGSAADSEHIVGELMKGFYKKRPVSSEIRDKFRSVYKEEGDILADNLQGALPAISLVSQTALITAYSNDIAPDMIFAQQVFAYGRSGDVLLGISTSGNSNNVINALKVARVVGMKTIGMTGRDGGIMNEVCDVNIIVPADSTPLIQESHLPIYHTLCSMLEEEFFEQ